MATERMSACSTHARPHTHAPTQGFHCCYHHAPLHVVFVASGRQGQAGHPKGHLLQQAHVDHDLALHHVLRVCVCEREKEGSRFNEYM